MTTERMSDYLFPVEPSIWVVLETFIDEVETHWSDLKLLFYLVVTSLHIENQLRHILCIKGIDSGKQGEKAHTHAPDISLVSVVTSIHYLWWHIQGSPTVCFHYLVKVRELFGKPQVRYLDLKPLFEQQLSDLILHLISTHRRIEMLFILEIWEVKQDVVELKISVDYV